MFDAKTNELWGSEMGPRGGDEINLLRAGHNYGWPLYSKGVDYDGTPVEYGKDLGIEFDLEDIEQPVVDLTPSPAVSNFVIYDGECVSRVARSVHRRQPEGDRALSVGDSTAASSSTPRR